jgi:hypothetical protein
VGNSNALAKKAAAGIDDLRVITQVHDEELNMLWWVFGAYSNDAKKSFKDLTGSEACLLVGKELSDVTELTPGPVAVGALIHRALANVKDAPSKTSIQKAVSATSLKWRDAVIKDDHALQDICPLHDALLLSTHTKSSDDWLSTFESTHGIAPKSELEPTKLANQFYTESMLIRVCELAKRG